jgi:energy-converting hydrogenase A subunit M
MQLIVSGNPNTESIQKVVYLANKFYSGQITKVLFIDNISSVEDERGNLIHKGSLFDYQGNSIEGKRNEIVRHYIHNVSIESTLVERGDLHQAIPKILSDKLKIYDRSQIVVDLTNGDKYISSTLYASASLSQIDNLFFLVVNKDKFGTLPEDLSEDDYKIDVISPLGNLESIGKHTFFEIFYYKDKVSQLTSKFSEVEFKSSYLKNQLKSQLESCIDSYFLEQYSDAISKISQIIEEISVEIPDRVKQIAAGEITEKTAIKNLDDSIRWLRSNFCDPLRGKKNKNLSEYQEKLKDLQTLDILIDLVRVHRNISSHPYDFLRGWDEARLVISTSLYILDKVEQAKVFSE